MADSLPIVLFTGLFAVSIVVRLGGCEASRERQLQEAMITCVPGDLVETPATLPPGARWVSCWTSDSVTGCLYHYPTGIDAIDGFESLPAGPLYDMVGQDVISITPNRPENERCLRRELEK